MQEAEFCTQGVCSQAASGAIAKLESNAEMSNTDIFSVSVFFFD